MTLSISLSPATEAKLREKATAMWSAAIDVYAMKVLEQARATRTLDR